MRHKVLTKVQSTKGLLVAETEESVVNITVNLEVADAEATTRNGTHERHPAVDGSAFPKAIFLVER